MKRRDFLKWLGLLPIAVRQIRLEETSQPPAKPVDKPILQEDKELSFESRFVFSGPLPYSMDGYPHKVKLSRRLKYAWDKLRWKIRERLHGRDYWDDY